MGFLHEDSLEAYDRGKQQCIKIHTGDKYRYASMTMNEKLWKPREKLIKALCHETYGHKYWSAE
jgi:hypothetical protein